MYINDDFFKSSTEKKKISDLTDANFITLKDFNFEHNFQNFFRIPKKTKVRFKSLVSEDNTVDTLKFLKKKRRGYLEENFY